MKLRVAASSLLRASVQASVLFVVALTGACNTRRFPEEFLVESRFRLRVVAPPYRLTSVTCRERVKTDTSLAWPLHLLTVDTRSCARCPSELDHRSPADTLLRAWVIVSPDSQAARGICERFNVSHAYVVPDSLWEYDRKGGVVRWYDLSAPHSTELRGGYPSLDSAVMAIARVREREVAYPVMPIGSRNGPQK